MPVYFDTEYDEGSVSVPLQSEEKINVENFVQTIEEQINKLTPFIGELTSEQGLINKRDTVKPAVNSSTEKPIITQNYNFPFPTIAFHQLIGNESLNITRDRIVINHHHHTSEEVTTEQDSEETTNFTEVFETTTEVIEKEDKKDIEKEKAKKIVKEAEKKIEEAEKKVEEEIKEIEEKIAEVEAEPVILTQGV